MADTIVLSIDHIVKTPGVCGGEARVDGTRLPVWTLVAQLQSGATIDELLEGYAHIPLSRAQVHAVLAYYYDHQPEIDAAIQVNDRLFAEGKGQTNAVRLSISSGEAMISAGEAADLLGLSRESSQVAHLCREGKLDCQKVANRWFVSRDSVERYAQSNRSPGPKSDSTTC
jgi:uncharacterized protein (DUF433 family)